LLFILIHKFNHRSFIVFGNTNFAILYYLDFSVRLICLEITVKHSPVSKVEHTLSLPLVVAETASITLTVWPGPCPHAVSLPRLPISDVGGSIGKDPSSFTVVLVMFKIALIQGTRFRHQGATPMRHIRAL